MLTWETNPKTHNTTHTIHSPPPLTLSLSHTNAWYTLPLSLTHTFHSVSKTCTYSEADTYTQSRTHTLCLLKNTDLHCSNLCKRIFFKVAAFLHSLSFFNCRSALPLSCCRFILIV